jgi:hypothetical protein
VAYSLGEVKLMGALLWGVGITLVVFIYEFNNYLKMNLSIYNQKISEN